MKKATPVLRINHARVGVGEGLPMADASEQPVKQSALPPPFRRGLCRIEAAQYVGVSPTTFDKMVADGLMPRPKRVYGRLIWDVRALDSAIDLLPSDGVGDISANPFD